MPRKPSLIRLAVQAAVLTLALAPQAHATGLELHSGDVYDGGGRTIRADDCGSYACSAISVKDARDVIIRNVTVVGTNPTGADGVDRPGGSWEWQHGIFVANSHNVRIENVRARGLWGDAVALQQGSSNVTVDGLISRRTGRNGVSFVNVTGARLVNSDISGVGFGWLVDMEPDYGSDSVRDITVAYNRFGRSRMANVNLSGPYGDAGRNDALDPNDSHPWADITVAFNEFTASNEFMQPHVWLHPLSGFYGVGVSVHHNCGARVRVSDFDDATLWRNRRGRCTRRWRAKRDALVARYRERGSRREPVGTLTAPHSAGSRPRA